MIIKNAKLKNEIFDISVKDGKIDLIGKDLCGDEVLDAKGKTVIPGLIDLHLHGFGGNDVSDGKLREMSIALAKAGTTCWLPTTMTDSAENLERITNGQLPTEGAIIAGFHLEGPYISPKKKGAQNEAYIQSPNVDNFKRFKNVKKITVAPEMDGCIEFIKQVAGECSVSIGHTDCTYDDAVKAIEAGSNSLTHTFNAMPPMLHRAPGPIGAAMEKNIYAEVICDGKHVQKAAVLALYKMFGSDRMILISDTIRPAGCPDGKYDSGGLDVYMQNGVATLKDGTLAGGSQPLLFGVKKAVEFGIDFYEAVKMATETPANSIGLNKGRVEEGFDADLLVLNDDLSIDKVIIGGKTI
ncbi:MAG: N-acetylglucosamine-6-phosphate deacetylase [Clostridia bacterium]|nr:N-acetylglucosamine-6-phosphate deacetylase [Clostridia bacterium]